MRSAIRALRKHPSFSIVAIVTLALGIGLNTAVFSVLYAVLLRPLPYAEPDRLALIWANFRSPGAANVAVSGRIFGEVELRQHSMPVLSPIFRSTPRCRTGTAAIAWKG